MDCYGLKDDADSKIRAIRVICLIRNSDNFRSSTMAISSESNLYDYQEKIKKDAQGKVMTNWKDKTIFIGDNLDIMRGMNSVSVDLIYLDPPFNSNRNYAAPIGSQAAGAAFKDTWSLSDVKIEEHGLIADINPALYQHIEASRLTHGKSMMAYLIMMGSRLLEMKRILKDTGSIYLHCDSTASHYLKLVMDSIFGRDNFQNEVIWKRTSAHNDPGRFGRIHDTLLFYVKEPGATWNVQYEAHEESYIEKTYRHQDTHGLGSFNSSVGGTSESRCLLVATDFLTCDRPRLPSQTRKKRKLNDPKHNHIGGLS